MPRPASSRPRAPEEAWGRNFSSGRSARLRAARRRLSARDRSAAVSASVPSKSKRTASSILGATQRVGHVTILAKAVLIRYGVVGHALEFDGLQPCVAAPARQLRGLDEARVIVRAPGQH